MGIGKSTMCSCQNLKEEEEKKNEPIGHMDFGPKESLKFTDMNSSDPKANKEGLEKSSNIFSSPKIKGHLKSHENLFTRIAAHKQEHLLANTEPLTELQLSNFLESLYDIDFELMDMMYNHLIVKPEDDFKEKEKITPVTNVTRANMVDAKEYDIYRERGLLAIAEGKLAVLVLSGGQGSRLGFEHPKGMYNLGMPSNRTLFEYFALRIKKMAALAQAYAAENGIPKLARFPIIWYVMTSEMNDRETKEYFAKNNSFGIPTESIIFFPQQSLPGLDLYGKIILEAPNKIFMAPNGNGGLYGTLLKFSIIKNMKENGVTHLQLFGVDNVLCKVADPMFMGYAQTKGYDVAARYVRKSHPKENVGVHILRNGKPHMIEYSEIGPELSHLRDSEGNLVYDSSNILNIIFRVSFLEDIVSIKKKELAQKYHVAKKKIKYYDDKLQQAITPLENNGYKFELFITDAYLLCEPEKFGLLEALREEEFAPVKNAPGSADDSPDTARALISRLHQKWLIAKGLGFSKVASGVPEETCEISPSVAYDNHDLNVDTFKHLFADKVIELPFKLD
jgi:UDP-N-acetylglucosamine/UDP-N-acetylgalactosamine diphosphorylase